MVMISILYPNRNGSKSDQKYYINTHHFAVFLPIGRVGGRSPPKKIFSGPAAPAGPAGELASSITHMPMSIERLSAHAGFKGVSVVRGMEGGVPSPHPAYVAMCHYLFASFEDFIELAIAPARQGLGLGKTSGGTVSEQLGCLCPSITTCLSSTTAAQRAQSQTTHSS
jgi:hypothetical protein